MPILNFKLQYLRQLVGSSKIFKLIHMWPNPTLGMFEIKTTSNGRRPQKWKAKYCQFLTSNCNIYQILDLFLCDQTKLYKYFKLFGLAKHTLTIYNLKKKMKEGKFNLSSVTLLSPACPNGQSDKLQDCRDFPLFYRTFQKEWKKYNFAILVCLSVWCMLIVKIKKN